MLGHTLALSFDFFLLLVQQEKKNWFSHSFYVWIKHDRKQIDINTMEISKLNKCPEINPLLLLLRMKKKLFCNRKMFYLLFTEIEMHCTQTTITLIKCKYYILSSRVRLYVCALNLIDCTNLKRFLFECLEWP